MANETIDTTDHEPTEPADGVSRLSAKSRDLLVAVESATIPEERPVATTNMVARHVFNVEAPTRMQGNLVSDALSSLARQGYVGHDRIGGLDVWFTPRVEAFDEATDEAGGRGSDE